MRENILVVDDDPSVRDAFVYAFDEYRIATASTGKEALAALARPHTITLVILDVVMPDMTGIELLKSIKKKYHNMKAVIMTGYDSKDIVVSALRAHADDYIEKPFDTEHVRLVIDRLLPQAVTHNASVNIDDKIAWVKEYVDANFDSNISLKELSKDICLSHKYLSKKFLDTYKIGFVEYRLQLRMNKAKKLLAASSNNIGQISLSLGYNNVESFSKTFKKQIGMMPSAYKSLFSSVNSAPELCE